MVPRAGSRVHWNSCYFAGYGDTEALISLLLSNALLMSCYLCPVLEGEVESPVSGQASACSPYGSGSQAETLSRDWGWGGGGAGVISGPVRAHPTSAPLLTSAPYLSFSVSVWETETIGKRNPGEDRLLIICPSVHPAGAQFCLLGMGGGGMRGSSGTRFSTSHSSRLPPWPS